MKLPGRNEPCSCGSKQKYKHCCGRLAQNRDARMAADHSQTLRQKNIASLNAAAEIFGFNRPWDIIKRKISGSQVREFYEFVSRLWPQSTDLLSLLPEPSTKLRALYLGEYAPELIVKNVCRFGLYADEIILINPFNNPNIIAERYNPLVHPEEWIEETLKTLFQLMAMTPWVDKGFVTFIPNPGEFDRALMMETTKSATERLKDNPISQSEANELILTRHMRQKFLSAPDDYVERKYRETYPGAGDEEVRQFIVEWEKERLRDPFLTGETMDKMAPQFMAARSGASLEMGLYICQAIGAFPYTNMRYRWNEILEARDQFDSTSEVWTPLTRAFQSLDFKFLDHVTSKFAYTTREEDRLGGFRTYLRKVWMTVDGSPDPEQAERLARDFSDELSDSYQKAKREWAEIDLDLLKWVGGGGLVTGVASGIQTAFSNGRLSVELPAAGFVLNCVAQLIQSRINRRNFRKTTPMSAFIDLEQNARN